MDEADLQEYRGCVQKLACLWLVSEVKGTLTRGLGLMQVTVH